MPRGIPGRIRPGHGRHGQATRKRRLRLLALLDYEPDADDLFLRPGESARLPRRRARHRAGGRSRDTGRPLIPLVVLAAVAFLGGTALAGFGGGAGSSRPAAPGRAPVPVTPGTAAPAGGSPSASAMRRKPMKRAHSAATERTASPPASPAPAAPLAAPPTATALPAAASPAATSGEQAVVVRYVVDSRWEDGFQAEVDVLNTGTSPISGWQIVLVLPHDQITSVQNADGYVSHHILLLNQASSSPALTPGSTLRVLLTVQGSGTVPELCAFNNTACQ